MQKFQKVCKAFANGLSAKIKFLKTQFSKFVQLGQFAPGLTN